MRLVVPIVLFRGLAGLLLVLYFVLAGAILVLRYLVLPNIDDYRDEIETWASSALGVPVVIGDIQADWYRLNPQLTLLDTSIRTQGGNAVLNLPKVAVRLSWASLFTQRPELLQLRLERPSLSLRRDAQGTVHVAGFPLFALVTSAADDAETPGPGDQPAWAAADHPVARWLLSQPDIRVVAARIDWHDETGDLPSFNIPAVDLQLQARRLGPSRFVLAVPGEFAGGRQWRLQAEWQRGLLEQGADGLEWGNWYGRVFASAEAVDLQALQPWLDDDVPDGLAGLAAGRAWFEFHHGRWRSWQADVALRNGRGLIADAGREAWALSDASVRLDGVGGRVQLRGKAQGALLYLPAWFADPVATVRELSGTVIRDERDGSVRWQWSDVRLDAGDPGHAARVSAEGNWAPEPGLTLGRLDLSARIEQAEAGAVARWMPTEVDADVRDWLREGLRAGRIQDAEVRVEGDLQGFPFAGVDRDRGAFQVAGDVSGVAIDLVPDAEPRWPLLSGLKARVTIDRDHLGADISSGEIRVGSDAVITLGATRLDIPEMGAEPFIEVSTQTEGAGEAYLAYLRQSPLAEETEAVLGAARIQGRLKVPLSVRVRLEDGETEVAGTVELQGNTVMMADWPAPVTSARGQVKFTESQVEFTGLRGLWLGGDLRVSGRTRPDGSAVVDYQGKVTVDALRARWPDSAWAHAAGQLSYQGAWRRQPAGREVLTLSSELEGLALNLPSPLHKTAAESWPLRGRWESTASGGDWQMSVADRWQLRAAWPAGADLAAMPPRLAVGVPGPLALPERGWHFNVAAGDLDLDAWHQVLSGSTPRAGNVSDPGSGGRRLPWAGLPLPLKVELNARQLTAWDHLWEPVRLGFEITHHDVVRLRVEAEDAKGWVGWRPSSAAGPARLEVDFERLRLPRAENPAEGPGGKPATGGRATSAPRSREPWQDPARWPYVDIQVKELYWGRLALGTLGLSASPGENGTGWRVDSVALDNPDITLRGKGGWRLGGEQPRTVLEVSGNILDSGRLLDRLGLPGVISGGQGSVEAKAGWPGAPWEFALRELESDLALTLDDGRFLPVSSAAGRLLATLSLQALARAVTFQGNNLFEAGFVWDTLRSNARVADGQLLLKGFEMRGPSAAALLSGEADLMAETQDLKAVIMPRIDASAAALLAGLAINPVVGLSAFLGQWLLRAPLAQVFSLEYGITGSWADPQVTRLGGFAANVEDELERLLP